MTGYAYGDPCPVCDREVKRRPAEYAGRPCAGCMRERISARDAYRLRNARLTPDDINGIIERARRAKGATHGTGETQ